MVQEVGKVLLAVVHDEEHGLEAAAHRDLVHLDDVLVLQPEQDRDLPQPRHRDAVLLPLHPHLLERHDLAARLGVPRLVHDAVLPFANVVQLPKIRTRKDTARTDPSSLEPASSLLC